MTLKYNENIKSVLDKFERIVYKIEYSNRTEIFGETDGGHYSCYTVYHDGKVKRNK